MSDLSNGKQMSDLSNENQIQLFLHCALCLMDKPDEVSGSEWVSLDVGWTAQGLQVWCKRHDCNVVHIDFEGQTHPANSTRKPD